MSATTSTSVPLGTADKPRLWNDPAARGLLAQGALIVLLAGVAWFGWSNLSANIQARGLTFGFDYLARPAGFEIGEALIPYQPSDSYGWALAVGLVNTLRIAFVGIVLSTLLGVALGVARLLPNPLLSGLVGAYVEVIRNTPVVLQLVLWYAIINTLPGPRSALSPAPGFFLSNRGFQIPWLDWSPELWPVVWSLVAGIVATVMAKRLCARRQALTGRRSPLLPWALGFLVALPLAVAALCGWPLRLSVPQLSGFNFRGGLTLTPEFTALQFGLTLYTAAFTAEIVRGGILSVSKGQWEAGRSIGLSDRRIMRLVVLPQALRVIIPPLTSNLLSLTKNSSLAVVIGYPDLVHVSNTTMNQTGRAVEAIMIFALVYLVLSLATSLFMNWYNARVAIRER
jgi:general L-amino acid transport system permease protein